MNDILYFKFEQEILKQEYNHDKEFFNDEYKRMITSFSRRGVVAPTPRRVFSSIFNELGIEVLV